MEALFQALLSSDNAIRAKGEDDLNNLRSLSPGNLVANLIAGYKNFVDPVMSKFSLVILRRQLKKKDKDDNSLWDVIEQGLRDLVCSTLLSTLSGSEPCACGNSKGVVEAAAELLAIVANHRLEGGGWPELWSFLENSVMSPHEQLQITALTIFERLGSVIGESEEHEKLFPAFTQVFLLRMGNGGSLKVRLAAVKAAASMLMFVLPSSLGVLGPTLLPMLHILQECIEVASGGGATADDALDAAKELLGVLTEVMETPASKLLTPQLSTVVPFLTGVASRAGLPSELRRMSCETLVMYAEQQKKAARKCKSLRNALIPILLSFIAQPGEGLQNLGQWEVGCMEDDEETSSEENDSDYGTDTLNRFAAAIKGKKVLEALQPHLASALSSPRWEDRRAGLCALEQCAGEMEDDEDGLRSLAHQIAPFSRDSDPRVRASLQDVLAAFCNAKSPLFQMFTHPDSAPCIILGLRDPSRRVRHNALYAVCAYVGGLEDKCDRDYLVPYLPELKVVLLETLTSSQRDAMLFCMCITCLTKLLASAATDGLSKEMFPILTPPLLNLLETSDTDLEGALLPPTGPRREDGKLFGLQGYETPAIFIKNLKGRALECVTLVGKNAGRENFTPLASRILPSVVGLLVDMQTSRNGVSATDDPMQSYCWDALSRLYLVLNPADLVPFLPKLFSLLFTAIQADTFETTTGEGGGGEDEEDEEIYVNVLTDAVSDKVSAVVTLRGIFDVLVKCTDDDVASTSKDGTTTTTTTTTKSYDDESAVTARAELLAPYSAQALKLLMGVLEEAGSAGVYEELQLECSLAISDVLSAMARAVHASALPGALEAATAAAAAVAGIPSSSPGGTAPTTPAVEPPPPASFPELYLRELGKSLAALAESLNSSWSVSDERETGNAEMTISILDAMKNVILTCCSRESYAGVPRLPASSPFSQPPGGPELVGRRFFPLLSLPQLDSLTQSFVAIHSKCTQRDSLRGAEKKVSSLEIIAKAYPQLPPETVHKYLDMGGGEGTRAVELLSKAGVFGPPFNHSSAAGAGGGAGDEEEEGDREWDEELADEEDSDALVGYHAIKALGTLLSVAGPAVISAFNTHVAPQLACWLAPGAPSHLLRNAVYLMVDILDCVGDQGPLQGGVVAAAAAAAAATRTNSTATQCWHGEILPRLISMVGDSESREDCAQASAYGIGVAATSLPAQSFAPYLNASVEALKSAIWRLRGKPNHTHNNCVTSLVKIVIWHLSASSGLAPTTAAGAKYALWGDILGTLPLTEDLAEAAYMARVLCGLVLTDESVLQDGSGGQVVTLHRLVPILKTFAFAGSKRELNDVDEFADGPGAVPLSALIKETLSQLQRALPGDVLAVAFQNLSDKEKKILIEMAK